MLYRQLSEQREKVEALFAGGYKTSIDDRILFANNLVSIAAPLDKETEAHMKMVACLLVDKVVSTDDFIKRFDMYCTSH